MSAQDTKGLSVSKLALEVLILSALVGQLFAPPRFTPCLLFRLALFSGKKTGVNQTIGAKLQRIERNGKLNLFVTNRITTLRTKIEECPISEQDQPLTILPVWYDPINRFALSFFSFKELLFHSPPGNSL
jgi:hypothetical protein